MCFHNAGSSESVYTGKGLRQTSDNPFVLHCNKNGGELLAVQLPGRDARRAEPRHRSLKPYCEQIYPVLAPLLQDEAVPMSSWRTRWGKDEHHCRRSASATRASEP